MGKTFKNDHSFPSSFGFSGSAGKRMVRGYMRGGPTSSPGTVGRTAGKAQIAGDAPAPKVQQPGLASPFPDVWPFGKR